jgi:putative membrane protein
MRSLPRFGTTLALGASLLTLGACGGGANDTTTTAGGETTPAAGAAAPGTTDSAAAAAGVGNTAAAGAASALPNAADLSGLPTMSPADQMALLGASNAAEILTSEAALDKLQNADAKRFARDMIAEHRTMQKQADQLATRLNVTPGSPQMATDKARMANEMAVQLKNAPASNAANGDQYLDRQYIDGQVLAHQQTLNELQAMQTTSNAEIATLVKGAIPKVQAHIERAQKIQSQLGGANAGANNGMNNGAVGTAAGTANQGSMSSSAPAHGGTGAAGTGAAHSGS